MSAFEKKMRKVFYGLLPTRKEQANYHAAIEDYLKSRGLPTLILRRTGKWTLYHKKPMSK